MRRRLPCLNLRILFLCFAILPRTTGADERATTVPSLAGLSPKDATQHARIAGVGLVSGTFYTAHSLPAHVVGEVAFQTPKPGVVVPRASTVACWTLQRAAADQRTVTMPDLRGTTVVEAMETTRGAKLILMNLVDERKPSDGVSTVKLVVIDQFPRAATPVFEGTGVFIVVEPHR